MGNFVSDTLGKIASNVTQSVVSALIVTAITTYLIVAPGKKDEKGAADADSAKSSSAVGPVEKPGVREPERSIQKTTDQSNPDTREVGAGMNAGDEPKAIVVPAATGKTKPTGSESPATTAADKAYKELPAESPAEQKLQSNITQSRSKGDSLAKTHAQVEKNKEIKQEPKKEVKDVKKRSDEVFDELDQETQK